MLREPRAAGDGFHRDGVEGRTFAAVFPSTRLCFGVNLFIFLFKCFLFLFFKERDNLIFQTTATALPVAPRNRRRRQGNCLTDGRWVGGRRRCCAVFSWPVMVVDLRQPGGPGFLCVVGGTCHCETREPRRPGLLGRDGDILFAFKRQTHEPRVARHTRVVVPQAWIKGKIPLCQRSAVSIATG